jgi:hypothetical protein
VRLFPSRSRSRFDRALDLTGHHKTKSRRSPVRFILGMIFGAAAGYSLANYFGKQRASLG